MSIRFHLAQVNIGRLRAAIDDPIMDGFRTQLDPINAIADRSPGFVWRLQTEDGNATAIRPYADERMAINMSVWESLEALRAFTYSGAHLEVFKQRRDWFSHLREAATAMWWVPAGHVPDVAEARARLDHLRAHGPSAFAFPFGAPFPDPAEAAAEPV
jgi:heme-degrading monooxygenase HmoA